MINRTGSAYVDLPPELVERRCKTVKMQLSVTINCPPRMEKKYRKFIEKLEEDATKEFVKFTKKQIKKVTEDQV